MAQVIVRTKCMNSVALYMDSFLLHTSPPLVSTRQTLDECRFEYSLQMALYCYADFLSVS